MENYKLIRGDRIIQQLIIEEVTTSQLDTWTQAFVPSTQPRQTRANSVQIVEMKLIPMQDQREGMLKVVAKAKSKNKLYTPLMMFTGVIYEEEDQPTNISFDAANGEEYHMLPIQLSGSNVQVRCDCLDFYYRFAYWDASKKGLYGAPIPKYKRKTTTHPEANPQKVPGMCKHLLATVSDLKTAGMVR